MNTKRNERMLYVSIDQDENRIARVEFYMTQYQGMGRPQKLVPEFNFFGHDGEVI